MSKKIIGIVGGVGPAAGLDLFQKILDNTIADKDKEHIPVLLASLPHLIEDRTEYLLGNRKKNPAKGIVKVINKLEAAGANIIGIPCNTAHAPQIFNKVIKHINPDLILVNMIEETVKHIKKTYPEITKIGVLATTGSYKIELYKLYLEKEKLNYIIPDKAIRMQIQDAIYDQEFGIKAVSNPVSSKSQFILNEAIQHLILKGAETIVLGCTELALAIPVNKCSVPLIDPANILARKLVKLYDRDKLRKI
jgi:aspartate racemase